MKRLIIAGLIVVALGVVVSTAVASSGGLVSAASAPIYDSTAASKLPGNLPSYGAEAYAFRSLGDKVHFAGVSRKLNSVVVTMSSWACQHGSWKAGDCATETGATFPQALTLTIWNGDHTKQIVSSTRTFDIPYRPSASPQCGDGRWWNGTACFNGLATKVTFGFTGNVMLPDTVVYEISYDTNTHGPNPVGKASPADSLNIAFNVAPSVGSDVDPATIWVDGALKPIVDFDSTYYPYSTPAVQFNAAKLAKLG